MNAPSVHSCVLLLDENVKLKKKLKKYKHKTSELTENLRKKQEIENIQEILRDHVTKRNAFSQTDKPSSYSGNDSKREQLFYKMVNSQTSLRNLYDKEVRKSKESLAKINEQKNVIEKCEATIKSLQTEIAQLKAEKRLLQHGKQQKPQVNEMSGNTSQIDQLKEENAMLREELRGLDTGFFEEIEDLKFSLQEADKLNDGYEHCLRALCDQYGLPFPVFD